MAVDKKISELDEVTNPSNTAVIPVVSAGSTKKLQLINIPHKTALALAASDEVTALEAGPTQITFCMPYGMVLTEVRASLSTAQSTGDIFTVDINKDGTSILSTKLTIENTDKKSTTATTPAVISVPSLEDEAEITIDIDQVGDGTAKGLKVYLIGTRA